MKKKPSQASNPMSDAEKIRRANIANIIKKLKEGKTLTGSEQRALAEYEGKAEEGANDTWVPSTTALAKAMGVSRQAIYDARGKFPDEAPRQHPNGRKENLTAWQKFAAEKGILIGANKPTETRETLLQEKLKREIERLDIMIAKERRTLVSVDEVDQMILDISLRQKQILFAAVQSELPIELEGLKAAEIRNRLRAMAIGICAPMQELQDKWNEQ